MVHLIWVFFIWQLLIAAICHLVYCVNVAHYMDPTWTRTLVYIQLKSYVYDRSPLWLVHGSSVIFSVTVMLFPCLSKSIVSAKKAPGSELNVVCGGKDICELSGWHSLHTLDTCHYVLQLKSHIEWSLHIHIISLWNFLSFSGIPYTLPDMFGWQSIYTNGKSS
jgi:hypothetical protein